MNCHSERTSKSGNGETAYSDSPADMAGIFGPETLDFQLGPPYTSFSTGNVVEFSESLSDHRSLSKEFAAGSGLEPATPSLAAPSREHLGHFTTRLDSPAHPPRYSLPRRKSKYQMRASSTTSKPLAIPNLRSTGCNSQPLTLQRWQDSPPEDEPASSLAIFDAVQSSDVNRPLPVEHSYDLGHFADYRGPASASSVESGVNSDSSFQSGGSSHSISSVKSHRSSGRSSRTRAKARAAAKHKPVGKEKRIFCCTFCCDTFKHKYDWSRHEKSKHVNVEEWTCTPHGGLVTLSHTQRVHCAYCNILDPGPEHLQSHNHDTCLQQNTTSRIFRRKDHLVQHLRLVHKLETLPLIDDWKVEVPITSRCGFCDVALHSWSERTDHLVTHFRTGKTMLDWYGEHGFESHVIVTNSLAPYLIGFESLAPIPFSATNPDVSDQYQQILLHIDKCNIAPSQQNHQSLLQQESDELSRDPDTTRNNLPLQYGAPDFSWADVFSRQMSRFATRQLQKGIVPTDEMLRQEGRRILYDDGDDGWNTTLADNPEWMKNFRRQHALSIDDIL